MSTSTRKRQVTDEILESLDDLVRARPHMRKMARFGPAEYRLYQEGYYWGVTMALNVTMLAMERFESVAKWQRSAARKKRSA